MLKYTIRRLIFTIPVLLFISLVIFLLLDLSPGDPTAQLPMTVPPEVREHIRQALGLGEPMYWRYLMWCNQFFIIEPLNIIEQAWGISIGDSSNRTRVMSWSTRSPVVDLIIERTPQTLWVVGMSYIVGIIIAIPIGVISAYRQYSWFDQTGTFISMVGFSVPTFFTGVLLIVIFSTLVPTDSIFWLPSIYDTTHKVTDWDSFVFQIRQILMPVFVLGLYNASQISRFMRASMLDNLSLDYVRTARAKGMKERVVLLVHVLRNSLIPVVTVLALNIPHVFGGAIITEQVFKVNGLGALLILGIEGADIPVSYTHLTLPTKA